MIIANGDHLPPAGTGPNSFQYVMENSGILNKTLVLSETTDPSTGEAYQLPIPRSNWPTLGSILDSGKQFLMFMDSCAEENQCADQPNATYKYIHPEFQYVSEFI